MARQRTIGRAVEVEGIGLHSGETARLTLSPAAVGSGLMFVLPELGVEIPARSEHVRDVAWATTLGLGEAQVGTVEHLLAALYGLGVSNARLAVWGREIPILDGSARPFVELIRDAGIVDQNQTSPEIRVLETVRVADGDRSVELSPADELRIDYAVHFEQRAIGRQRFSARIDEALFASGIAPARTFGFLGEAWKLRRAGLGRGGSLDNCVIVDDARVLSGELRWSDEFVRHKVLDLLGNLALLEYPLRALITARRAGHDLHVAALKALLARPECWDLVEPERVAPLTVHPYFIDAEAELA